MDLDTAYRVVGADGKTESLSLAKILATAPRTILYFYPKDDTPGCTLEARDFTRLASEFASEGIAVVGVSRDSADSHADFHGSCALGIPLVSDPDETLHNAFGVIGEKNNYGKIIVGVRRSTFLLDTSGTILAEWRNVRATGHAEKILKTVRK